MAKGKEIAGAEFCAPMAYWHGHVHDLSRALRLCVLTSHAPGRRKCEGL